MIVQQARERAGNATGYASRAGGRTAEAGGEGASGQGPRGRADAARAGRSTSGAQDSGRVKRLAAIAATSVAVALMAAAYGTWAALSAQAAVDAAGADAQPTLVAAADLRAGEVLDASSFDVRSVPRSLRVATALGAEALEGPDPLIGQRVLADVPAGAQITPGMVAGRTDGDRLSAALGSGSQAVTVAVDAESGLAGQLRPSDRVRVVALEGAASGEALVSTICDGVRVMALDGDRVGAGGAYASVTLEVTPEQADAVRAAQGTGKVSLVLMPALAEPAADGTEGPPSAPSPGGEAAKEEGDVDG